MLELSIRTRSMTGYVRLGGNGGTYVIDWDKAAREQKELNDKADRQGQLDEQRSVEFYREVGPWMLALGAKFVAEADRYNATRATTPSEKIEISHGEGGVELRKLTSPGGFLGVQAFRNRDSAELKCTVAGNAPDGRAETTITQYSATYSPIGFVIRNAGGRAVSEDSFVQEVMMPFARYISG